MTKIERQPARGGRRSGATAYKDLVFAVATADDRSFGIEGQAQQALEKIDVLLRALGSAPTRVLTAAVYLSDISRKPELEAAWNRWVSDDPAQWPMRSCVQATLPAGVLVEIAVTAVRDNG